MSIGVLGGRSSGLLAAVILLAGCGDPTEPLAMAPNQRQYDAAQLRRGEQLYDEHCASCHGPDAAGDANWRKRGADGRFPAPPLNGSAHAWHHPLAQLRSTISNGGPPGQSNMPAWKDTLSATQIDDIIAWFQSMWPDQAYASWYAIEQRAHR